MWKCQQCGREHEAGEDILSSDKLSAVLSEAISALHFNDDRYYYAALWVIIGTISPKAAELLKRNEEAAYKKYV